MGVCITQAGAVTVSFSLVPLHTSMIIMGGTCVLARCVWTSLLGWLAVIFVRGMLLVGTCLELLKFLAASNILTLVLLIYVYIYIYKSLRSSFGLLVLSRTFEASKTCASLHFRENTTPTPLDSRKLEKARLAATSRLRQLEKT
jgi:hypothetical protein